MTNCFYKLVPEPFPFRTCETSQKMLTGAAETGSDGGLAGRLSGKQERGCVPRWSFRVRTISPARWQRATRSLGLRRDVCHAGPASLGACRCSSLGSSPGMIRWNHAPYVGEAECTPGSACRGVAGDPSARAGFGDHAACALAARRGGEQLLSDSI